MFSIESTYSSDHDSMAGYSERIGYRYKTVVTVKMTAKYWNTLKKKKQIGSLVCDVGNACYKQFNFKQTYNPQVDTKVRAKQGFVTVNFDYFHNSDEDALKMGYNFENGYMRHHQRAAKQDKKYEYNASQWELDPNNQNNS